MRHSINILSLVAVSLLPAGCMQGGFLMRASECPEGQTRTGGSMCVPVTAETAKLGATSCKDPDLASVKAGVEVTLCDGSVGVGTLGVCSEDGQSGCVADGVFKVVKTDNVEPGDIRLGKTIAGITGTKREMKQCRNAADLATWDASSFLDAASGTSSPNSIVDLWDLVDDYNAGNPATPSQSLWGSAYVCDSSNFTNVSSSGLPGLTPTGGAVGCNQNFKQIWRDELTGLYFTNALCNNLAPIDWEGVVSMCANLNSGDGAGNWRLPTQKEMLQLYINGVSRLVVDGWADYFWTATGVSYSRQYAWIVEVTGDSFSGFFADSSGVAGALCVR